MTEFTLPWPPSVNHYWRHNRGIIHISREGVQYRDMVAEEVLLSWFRKTYMGRLDVMIFAYPPDRRKRDLDNILKATLDALGAAGVYQDDAQIDVLSIRRMDVDKPKGHIFVRVMEVQANED
jgi:crossover junction endodeoxyribonuclease RusA